MAGNGDMNAHAQTYHKVITVLKYGARRGRSCIAFAVIWLIIGQAR